MALETRVNANALKKTILLRIPASILKNFLNVDYVYVKFKNDTIEISPVFSIFRRKKRRIDKGRICLHSRYIPFLAKSNRVIWFMENGIIVGKIFYDNSNKQVLTVKILT